jgi:phosphomannomutase
VTKPHRFNPTVLREYDIRGVVGKTIGNDDAYAVGRGFGTVVARGGGRQVCVGYDGRLSSPELEAAVIAGVRDCGLEAWRAGIGPTPLLYFSTLTQNAAGGIMITGSHNPPDQNGFKMMLGKAAFYGEAIQDLGRIAAKADYAGGPQGAVVDKRVFDPYVDRLVAGLTDAGPAPRPLTVAWDAGNGAAGEAMAALVRRLPGTHFMLNEKIDGTFPSHHPDPTVPENLKQLIDLVRAKRCDLGLAFDGDGDRVGAVDGQGRVIWADQMMILFAREVLKSFPGATIISDVKASQTLFDEIARAGGKPLMWKTGHSLIKAKMAELGSPFSGEMSGHLFFGKPFYGFDDALYAAVRLMALVGRAPESLAQMRDALPPVVNTPEVRFPSSEERKFAVVEEIKQRLRAAGADVSDIDGVRVKTGDGWWLLRASNTQDMLVARCEAADAAGLERLKAEATAALKSAGATPPSW